jgi:hypothetical protein
VVARLMVPMGQRQPTAVNVANLLGMWDFENDTLSTAYDSSDNSLDGQLMNGPVPSSDAIVGFSSLQFNASLQQSISLPFVPMPESETRTAWIKTASSNSMAILSFDSSTRTGSSEFRVLQNRIQFMVFDGATSYRVSSDPLFPVRVGEWQHVAMTRDGLRVSLYLNSRLVFQEDLNSVLLLNQVAAEFDGLRIGTRVGPTPLFFDGLLDDVRLFQTALNASEISRICELQRGKGVGGRGGWRRRIRACVCVCVYVCDAV